MVPQLLKVLPHHHSSFSVRQDRVPYFYHKWHFHPEIELVHIESGHGTQFIGDNIQQFKGGDLLLVGANLPHCWRCHEAFFEPNSRLTASSTVVHFKDDFWGDSFLSLPENVSINHLLTVAKRGISIIGKEKKWVIGKMQDLIHATGTQSIIILLEILDKIAQSNAYKVIASSGFSMDLTGKDAERINTIYAYSLANFKHKITLAEIAKQANISAHSFCHYFKSHTRKTYNNFLQELRVGHASKLLIENKLSITQICYESGFNNVTNFYKSFKKLLAKHPQLINRHF